MIFWTASTWILTPWFIHQYGPIGFAYVQLILSCSFVAVIFYSRKFLDLRLLAVGQVFTDLQSTMLPLVGKLRNLRSSRKQAVPYHEIDKLE
jgi:hypothetical protein